LLNIFTPYSVNVVQAVNVYLGYFATSSYGSVNLSNLCYNRSLWAYPLGAQLAGSTAA